jgi:hypothetical protein
MSNEHRKTFYGYPLCDVIKILQMQGYSVTRDAKPQMNVYEVSHHGSFLGGTSIVVAENEERALALTKFKMVEQQLPATDIRLIRDFPLDKAECHVIDNGDY